MQSCCRCRNRKLFVHVCVNSLISILVVIICISINIWRQRNGCILLKNLFGFTPPFQNEKVVLSPKHFCRNFILSNVKFMIEFSFGDLEDLICTSVCEEDKNLSSMTSTFPPVSFSPIKRAGMTADSLKTRRSLD